MTKKAKKEKSFYVRIISCENKNYWYNNYIGSCFSVVKSARLTNRYIVSGTVKMINAKDCVVTQKISK